MSQELFKEALHIFPGGVNSPVRFYEPYPRYMKAGSRSKIYDVDGKEYVDYVLAYGPLILGHANPRVIEEVKKSLDSGSIFGAPVEKEVELGKLIKSTTGIEKMRFVNSGTEATMHAIRLAIHYTGRKKVLKIRGGYHGTHVFNFPSEIVTEIDFNSLREMEEALKTREFSCVILEPIMGNIGVIPPEEGYLEEVRLITEKYGSLMLIDEVITGFRTGFFPFYSWKNVQPDLATFGKIVGGGFPLAIYGGKEEIMRKVRPSGDFPQAGTYSSNPISVTAGLETLKILSSKDYSSLRRLTAEASEALEGSGLTVNSATGMLSLFFSQDKVLNAEDAKNSRKQLYGKLFKKAISEGIYIPPSYDETMFISFSHEEEEVKRSFSLLGEVAGKLWKEA
jgi:glutamate-1-semialdehyde 2,1-aminomutase